MIICALTLSGSVHEDFQESSCQSTVPFTSTGLISDWDYQALNRGWQALGNAEVSHSCTVRILDLQSYAICISPQFPFEFPL